MDLKLYGRWSSPFLCVVALVLHEKNAEFEFVFSDMTTIKSEEFLKTKNPFGQMPTFEDDDLVLFESRAIVRYVVAKFEGQGNALMGSTLKEQALVNVWIEVESQSFISSIWPICREFYRKIVPDAGLIETNLQKLNKVLDIYEAQLSKHKYLAGDFVSLADLLHVPTLHFFYGFADDALRSVITSRPHVHAWHQDLQARPAWQKIVQIPEASDWSYMKKV